MKIQIPAPISNLSPDPVYVALCKEREVLETAFSQTQLAPLATAAREAEAAWINGTGSQEDLQAADEAFYAAGAFDPAAAWLFIRICNLNLQIRQHRLALGCAL